MAKELAVSKMTLTLTMNSLNNQDLFSYFTACTSLISQSTEAQSQQMSFVAALHTKIWIQTVCN